MNKKDNLRPWIVGYNLRVLLENKSIKVRSAVGMILKDEQLFGWMQRVADERVTKQLGIRRTK